VTVSASTDRIRAYRRDELVFDVIDRGPLDGETVVLLHGFPGAAESWNAVIERLNRAGYRTLAPNQRGYSTAARPRRSQAYRIGELVGDVLALADRAGLRQFHVIGHDWGGFVAWHLAARWRPRVQSLVVLSTPHPRAFAESLTRSAQLLRSSYALAWQLPVVPELALTSRDGALLRLALRGSGLPDGPTRAYTRRMLEAGALTAALNWYRAAARHPAELFDVGAVTTPTLYLWSSNDSALGRTAAERTANHVAGPYRFEILDGVSHWIPETAPAAVVELFLQMSSSVSSVE
jgi:pimeloyl-ACP methyl ester carboxylesterase